MSEIGQLRFDVPDGETPERCPHCGRPFARESFLTLHLGLEHATRLDADDLESVESAVAAETAALRRYRLAAVGALVVVYFGFLVLFAVFA